MVAAVEYGVNSELTEIEKLQIELSSIRRLTVELEEGLIELRELQNSNKVFEEEKEDVVL